LAAVSFSASSDSLKRASTGGSSPVGLNVLDRKFRSSVLARACGADYTVFVDGHGDRHALAAKCVDRVVDNRHIHAFPSRKEQTAVRMLLLGDSQYDQPLLCDPFLRCRMPPWHTPAAAGSPGGEMQQENLFAAKIAQRNRFGPVD